MYFGFELEGSYLVDKDSFGAWYLSFFYHDKVTSHIETQKKISMSCRDESAELLVGINLQTLPNNKIK